MRDGKAELERVRELLRREGADWPQALSLGNHWYNPPFEPYDVGYIPFSVLLDRGGRVIATDLRGDSLDRAVERALAVP